MPLLRMLSVDHEHGAIAVRDQWVAVRSDDLNGIERVRAVDADNDRRRCLPHASAPMSVWVAVERPAYKTVLAFGHG